MPIYNKLVRDKIPKIIQATGKQCSAKILNNDEYIKALQKKSFEELQEYVDSKNNDEAVEELADILEIIHSFAEYHGVSMEEVEEVRKRKLEMRGGFKERIYLIEVEE
ncbi:phosphoribosyl-ATP pyrophosphohydrolase [Bacillus sp. S3]|uniref:nucleoside triphosphate pyrophosphohydrolase n=1 Tax=Bacillus sp. S3 TaxID=486398 RepID=UPI00118C9918|nr:nucleoside triphosphate pyrophosphohydrolase [Bacillus sp. S3]QCJ42578.1 phosphoribosyl-ATP pyrophosphohydrolase [Bacillus sp. S3]